MHLPGLEKWIFQKLDEEFGAKPKSVYTYKELLEMFEATTKLIAIGRRCACCRKPDGDETRAAALHLRATCRSSADRAAACCASAASAPGDSVMLLSENRPEWGITYFGSCTPAAAWCRSTGSRRADEVENLVGWVARARADRR